MKRISILGTLCVALILTAGCSDDDSGNQVCGNAVIEGTELCDMDQLGVASCVSEGFTGGTLTCNSECNAFDTSQCTNGLCGNSELDTGEECDTANLDGNDCTDVGNFVGGTLACSGTCTFDTSACTPPPNCGNSAIDAGEDCDTANLDGNDCTDVGNYAGGTLACAGDCTFDETSCVTVSDQIATAWGTADGTGLTLPINGAYVTYLKPELGADATGFFIQAEATGPALFIAMDPTTLTPAPAVGDEVSFSITEMGTTGGMRQGLAISGFAVISNGFNVATLIQDVSAATDWVANLDNYESELISFDATIISDFSSAGAPARGADIATVGYPTGDADLRLRIPGTVETALELSDGCTVSVVGTPMWRFFDVAQPSAWNASEITVNSCPAPMVVSATAPDATTVEVTFDRNIDQATVDAGDFTFDLGLTSVSIVSVVGNVVTVETVTQTAQAAYSVTVNTLTDTLGGSIDINNNTAPFTGFGDLEVTCDDQVDNDSDGDIDCLDADCASAAACAWGAQLYIWETDADTPGTDAAEFVELWNNTGAEVDFAVQGWYLMLVNGSDTLTYNIIQLGPTGTLADGDVWVVGSATVPNVDQVVFTTNGLQNGADGVLLVRCDLCTGTTDFDTDGNDYDPGTVSTITSISGATAVKIDGVAYDTNDGDITGLWSKLINVSVQWNEGAGGASSTESVQRSSLAGWLIGTATPGTL